MTEEWGQRNREAEVTNSRRVTRWVSVILPARFWHSFPCPHSFASIPGFRFIVVTQGVALGWMMERHWRSSPPGEIPIPGTPTAFHRSAQGCRSREAAKATLGLRSKIIMNPNGVPSVRTTQDLGRRIQPRWDCFDILAGSQGSACPRKRALQPSRGARAFPRLACHQAFGPRYIGVSTVFRLSAGFLTRRVNGN